MNSSTELNIANEKSLLVNVIDENNKTVLHSFFMPFSYSGEKLLKTELVGVVNELSKEKVELLFDGEQVDSVEFVTGSLLEILEDFFSDEDSVVRKVPLVDFRGLNNNSSKRFFSMKEGVIVCFTNL